MGAGTGDIAMSEPQSHWDQPPTHGWMGASAGDMGVGSGGAPAEWEQPPTSGWMGVGQPNIGVGGTTDEQPAGVGVSANNHY